MVADALSRNMPVGAVVERPPTIQHFSMNELANAQRRRLEQSHLCSGIEDESTLPKLPVPLTQFFLSLDKVLCRYWTCRAGKPEVMCTCGTVSYFMTLR